MHILLVEDEIKIASFVLDGLRSQKNTVDWLERGDEVLPQLAQEKYDLLILDILLPGLDGLSLLQVVRKRGHTLPILMLTALASPPERVAGLNAGADDYLGKPFLLEELIARVKALGRRSAPPETVLAISDLSLNLLTREVTRGQRQIEVTPREFTLLEFLIRCEGRTVSRAAILKEAWKYNFEPTTNVVDVFIKRLRQKIDGEDSVKLLHTIRHLGYALRVEP